MARFNSFLFIQGLETLAIAHASPLEERTGRGEVSRGPQVGDLGELPRPRIEPVSRAGEEVSSSGLRRDPHVRHQGRYGSRQALHRIAQNCSRTWPMWATRRAW